MSNDDATTKDLLHAATLDVGAVSAQLDLPIVLDSLKSREVHLDFATLPLLLDVKTVAGLLTCSTRHVYRLADAGRMPPPVKLAAKPETADAK